MFDSIAPLFEKYVKDRLSKGDVVFYFVFEDGDKGLQIQQGVPVSSYYPCMGLLATNKRNKLLLTKEIALATTEEEKRKIINDKYLPSCIFCQPANKVTVALHPDLYSRISPTECLLYFIHAFEEILSQEPVHKFDDGKDCSLEFMKKYPCIQIGKQKYINAIVNFEDVVKKELGSERHYVLKDGDVIRRMSISKVLDWLEEGLISIFDELKYLIEHNDWYKAELEKQKDVFSKQRNFVPVPKPKPKNGKNNKKGGRRRR